MSAGKLRTLLTFLSVVSGSAAQMPDLVSNRAWLAQALVALAGFFAGWAHMQKPEDPPAVK